MLTMSPSFRMSHTPRTSRCPTRTLHPCPHPVATAEGLDNLGTGVKSYTVLDWGVQRSSFVAIRNVNVTFGCVPSVGPGSPARELGPPVLDMAYR